MAIKPLQRKMYRLLSSLFSFVILLLLQSNATAEDEGHIKTSYQFFGSIGTIVDYSSREGKEEKIAMEMAIEDFYRSTGNKLVLHPRDSHGNSAQAASAAMDLINEQRVQAILGLRTWEEVTFVAKLGDKAQVPILSFANAAPPWAFQKWPFLVQATHNKHAQMRAVAAILGTWQWRRVNVIYEETNSDAAITIQHLIEALRGVGCEIDQLLPLPPLASSLSKELDKLKSGQCRVFIVHSSLSLATHLFMEAKKMGMMKDSVWIATDAITGLLDSANASVISSMQGILGIKSYFPQTGARFKDFYSRFQNRFHSEHPEETSMAPRIFALQAYDAVWAVAFAMEGKMSRRNVENSTNQNSTVVPLSGERLLERILQSKFEGMTGEFHFIESKLAPAHIFLIINVVGKSYRELGFWSNGSGFSESIDEGVTYNNSMRILGQVFWPGGPWSVPRGWVLPTGRIRLRIGVPAKSAFNQFVNVRYDHPGAKPSVDGFSIDVFKAALEQLPYYLPYEFIPYEGTYDSLVEQIYHKTFDAVVGDTSIVARRCQYAEFSQPWTESGLQMVVFEKSIRSNRAWLFMKPFTAAMWGLTGGINIYNGFVVWLIERMHHPEFNGNAWNQIGTLTSLAFTTLFSLQGDRMHSNLSRMTMVVWLFVALVITQSYTANLTSMLTIPRLESTVVNVDVLKKNNAVVGCDGGSYVVKYLEEALGFHPNNIRRIISEEDYPQALKSGEIAAAFLGVAHVKVFLAKYCKDFAVIGPTYKVGGFGFVFPRGSPMLPDISEAVLKVAESGKLLDLENAMISSYNCSSSDSDDDQGSLGVTSFWGLFVITGGTSTVALMLFILRFVCQKLSSEGSIHATPEGHAPCTNEIYMLSPEMDSQGHGLNLGEPRERLGELNTNVVQILH